MESFSIPYKSSAVEALKFGCGTKLLVAFHGFGDCASIFGVLAPALMQDYTVYAISLPYHGNTEWHEGDFTERDMVELVDTIREREDADTLSLMGYSMGGKIVLTLIEDFATKLDKVFLIAPDGVKTHKLYDVSQLPSWYVRCVKGLMIRPKLFFKVVAMAHQAGLLTKFLHDFTQNHFETEEQRKRFFAVYNSIQEFIPDLSQVKYLLNRYHIPVEMYFGERDEVITLEAAHLMREGLNNYTLDILPKGHLLLDEDLVGVMLKHKPSYVQSA